MRRYNKCINWMCSLPAYIFFFWIHTISILLHKYHTISSLHKIWPQCVLYSILEPSLALDTYCACKKHGVLCFASFTFLRIVNVIENCMLSLYLIATLQQLTIVDPVGHRSNWYTTLKHILFVLCQCHTCSITTITPAPNGCSFWINVCQILLKKPNQKLKN